MSSWSHGYNVSAGYTYGFYRELAPDWLNFGALLHGYRVPDAAGPFGYLELGCGQGFGLCVLAASYPQGRFLGVDFNPEHVAHARELAQAAGLRNLRFEEADFSGLARKWPDDYGRFDYAVLHGIYSWVPAPVRQSLIRCLDAAIVPGGLVYNSYNTLPGWTSALPLQHLLRRLQLQSSKAGPQIIRQGGELMQALLDANAAVGAALPPLRQRLDGLKTQNVAYLVQEYLHENWHPLWFSQVAEELAAAKLRHVGTATLPENYLPNLLSPALAQIVRGSDDPLMQQELIDLAINQSFRRDLYCRGPRRLINSMSRLAQYTLHANRVPAKGALQIPVSYNTLTVNAGFADAVFEALARGPQTIAALAALPVFASGGLAEAIQVATLLLHAGHVSLAGAQTPSDSIRAFNEVVAGRVIADQVPYGVLAARHTPNCVSAGDIDMALYTLVSDGDAGGDATALGARLLDTLLAAGRTVSQDGKPLETREEHLRKTTELAGRFLDHTLPLWKRLGVL